MQLSRAKNTHLAGFRGGRSDNVSVAAFKFESFTHEIRSPTRVNKLKCSHAIEILADPG
jgi:hypothetical protein